MADLKFIECENRRTTQDIKSGEFTDYMFMMYRKGEDGWYRNTLMPVSQFTQKPSVAAALCGLCVCTKLRVRVDKDGKCAFFAGAVQTLNSSAMTLGLPEADAVYAEYAFRELVRLERGFLSENSELIATLSIYSVDSTAKYPTGEAVFSITLEYRDIEEKSISVIEGRFGAGELCRGSAPEQSAVFRANFMAQMADFDRVLWLDGVYNKYILGIGDADLFVRFEDGIVSPSQAGGMTTDMVNGFLSNWGIETVHTKLSADEFLLRYDRGEVVEVFAVSETDGVMPVTKIDLQGRELEFEKGKLSRKLTDSIASAYLGVLLPAGVRFDRI